MTWGWIPTFQLAVWELHGTAEPSLSSVHSFALLPVDVAIRKMGATGGVSRRCECTRSLNYHASPVSMFNPKYLFELPMTNSVQARV
jgi:hypothetical protein